MLLYDYDPIGADRNLAGAGLLAFLTGDELHPPMVDDESMWREGRWRKGARQHTTDAAQLCGLQPGERVIDIGCGVGGPARTLIDGFDVYVSGFCTSVTQIKTASKISSNNSKWRHYSEFFVHDCRHSFPRAHYDVAWSMNMLYHVDTKRTMLQHARDALRTGGRLMIDDWMLTARATVYDLNLLQAHFVSPHFAVQEEFIALVAQAGFRIVHVTDFGHVGRTHLCTHFQPVFDRVFRESIVKYNIRQGACMADAFCEGVQATIRLYAQGKLTYCRLVAVKD